MSEIYGEQLKNKYVVDDARAGQAQTNAWEDCGAETIRISLRERIRNDGRHSKIESHRQAIKFDQLSRLSYVLDKNPEVADILDLMEQLK